MNKKILITGGTGFAGSHLVELLLSNNEDNVHVTTYDRRESFVSKILGQEFIHPVNLVDKQECFSLIEKLKPDQIYHLASISNVDSSFENIKKILDDNQAIQFNLLEAVKNFAPQARVLAVGSALEYDTSMLRENQKLHEQSILGPSSPYALSKINQDMMAHLYYHTYNLDIVRTRPFNHIGERQTPNFVVADFASQIVKIERGQQLELSVGNLAVSRDFCDVKDVVKAYVLLMNDGKSGEVYNIGSGKSYSIQTILDLLIKNSQSEIRVEVDQNKFRPLDVINIMADNEKIVSLGWQPTQDIEQTLIRVLDFFRSQN